MLVAVISQSLLFLIISAVLGFILAPPLIQLLKQYGLTRQGKYDDTVTIAERLNKLGTPVMGGLLVIVVVAVMTIIFNWDRRFTWVPIGVMALSAFLGGLDDILNDLNHK